MHGSSRDFLSVLSLDMGSVSVAVPKLDLVVRLDPPPKRETVQEEVICETCSGTGKIVHTTVVQPEPSIDSAPKRPRETRVI